MKQLMKTGDILSYEPADILSTTGEEVGSVFPAQRVYRHLEFIDCLIYNGKIIPNNFRKYREILFEARIDNMKEYAYKIDMNEDGSTQSEQVLQTE